MHGGRIYEYADTSGRNLDEILDFSANINPLGPPDSVMAAIQNAMEEIRHYPDARHANVLHRIAQRFDIHGKQAVFCGNGASEIIDLTLRALRPRRVFVFEPAFSEYILATHRVEAQVLHVALLREKTNPMEASRMEASAVESMRAAARMAASGDLVIINNPHNPTGLSWGRSEFVDIVEGLCAKSVYMVVDESFMDFRRDEGDRTLIPLVEHFSNLIVVRSATKVYSIPGLRFGFGCAHEDVVEQIEHCRDRWSVNHLAQVAAEAAYNDDKFLRKTWDWLQDEQAYVAATWRRHPDIEVYPTTVNFFLFRFTRDLPTGSIVRYLEREGMFVRRCESFQTLGPDYIRIAIKSHEDNELLWNTFEHITRQFA